MRKIKNKQLKKIQNITVVIDFTDGRRLNIQTNAKSLPQLKDQLLHRQGSVTANDQIFNFKDLVHFEVIDQSK